MKHWDIERMLALGAMYGYEKKTQKIKILVVGDEMRDAYWLGSVKRVNPDDANINLVDIHETKYFSGGSRNVVSNLIGLGVEVSSVTATTGIVKNRLIIDGNLTIRFDIPAFRIDHEKMRADLHVSLTDWQPDAVIVSDYGKGSITEKVSKLICQYAGKEKATKLFVNVKVNPQFWIEHANGMFANISETMADLETYLKFQDLFEYNLGQFFVLTQGSNGARIFFPKNPDPLFGLESPMVIPAIPANEKNATGAGDTFIASFVYCFLRIAQLELHAPLESKLQTAGEYASVAASIAVEDPFTYTAKASEIEDKLIHLKAEAKCSV